VFTEERDEPLFEWTMLGNLDKGRPNLGRSTDVSVYRLMQFTLRDALIKELGVGTTDHLFFQAGRSAGIHFYENLITRRDSFSDFIAELQDVLKDLGVGILRVEQDDLENLRFTIAVAEDLDCSGLPVCDETICTYDEGFLAGLFFAHTGKEFEVTEVDCWCSGGRVCRFQLTPIP
jgi:uncharacterized protein